MLEDWKPPPHYEPPAPIAWFLALGWPAQLALGFAYWLYLAAAGVMAGLGILGSLIGGLIGLLAFAGCYLAMIEARRREWSDDPREELWRVVAVTLNGLAMVIGGVLVVLPAIVLLVLAFWALASLPLWLFRR